MLPDSACVSIPKIDTNFKNLMQDRQKQIQFGTAEKLKICRCFLGGGVQRACSSRNFWKEHVQLRFGVQQSPVF